MSLVEILVAAAIFAVVCFSILGLVHEFANSGQRLATEQSSHADVAHLLDLWESEEASSDAVFVPGKDVFGNDNSSKPHEVDFYSKDAANRPYFWAYFWDSAAQTVQRYDYGSVGGAAQKDGPIYPGVVQFSPKVYALSEVVTPSSAIYIPVFASAQDYDVQLGIAPGVVGGTHVVHVDLATSSESVPVELSAGGAPSGFTVMLNYTPAPKAPSLLIVEPAAVQLASGGVAIAGAQVRPSINIASILNAMLGGGIADAAGSCKARAYNDAGFTQPVQPGSQVGIDIGVTDATGCFSGGIYVHEDGYSKAFSILNNTCAAAIALGPWNPSGNGPTARLQATGANQVASCNISLGDQNEHSQQQTVIAQVLQACTAGQIRESDSNCAGSSYGIWNSNSDLGMACDSGGVGNTEEIYKYTYSTPGTIVNVTPDGSGSATITGRRPGATTVKVLYTHTIITGSNTGPGCRAVAHSFYQHANYGFTVYADHRMSMTTYSGWLAGS